MECSGRLSHRFEVVVGLPEENLSMHDEKFDT
jgi:hypothetical protein